MKTTTSNSNADSQTDENIAKVWIKIPYLGKRGENIIKSWGWLYKARLA